MRVAINGLGRIGRAVFKVLVSNDNFDVVALNDIVDSENIAYLIKYDSVYGRFEKDIKPDKGALILEGKRIPLYGEKDLSDIPWQEHDIDMVFECTGVFNERTDLEKHLEGGAKLVILSAPAKGDDIPTVVFGVNKPQAGEKIISCASCTTNCIAPVVEIIDRHFGVQKASMTTVHAYTSTQGIVDSPNKKIRRGRAASENFVPTTTGATRATTQVIKHLKNKFEGSAIRGPVPTGSIADMNFVIKKNASKEEINQTLISEAGTERYKNILGATSEPLVSSDIIKDTRASVVDLEMTMSIDGDLIKVMSWYDNEWGYAMQMVRTAEFLIQQNRY